MRPVPVFPDYLVKLVIPASRAILKPAVICRCVSLDLSEVSAQSWYKVNTYHLVNTTFKISLLNQVWNCDHKLTLVLSPSLTGPYNWSQPREKCLLCVITVPVLLQICGLGFGHFSALVCGLLSRMGVYPFISWKVGSHRSGALCWWTWYRLLGSLSSWSTRLKRTTHHVFSHV